MAKRKTEKDLARENAIDYFANLEPSVRHAIQFVHVKTAGSHFECSVGMEGGVYLPAGYLFMPKDVGGL